MREALIRKYPGPVAGALSTPLLDSFAAVLEQEVYSASATACQFLAQMSSPATLGSSEPFMGFDPLAGGDPDLPGLLWFLRTFLAAIDQLTVPDGGGRRLPDDPGAVALSMAGDELNAAATWAFQCLQAPFTKRIDDGTSSDLRIYSIPQGRDGAEPALMAAVIRIQQQLIFPNARWNEMQRMAPGAVHNRFHEGDVLDVPAIELLASSERILSARVPPEAVISEKPKPKHLFGQIFSVDMLGPKAAPPSSSPASEPAVSAEQVTQGQQRAADPGPPRSSQLVRPVPIAEAAGIIGKRSDVVLDALRVRNFPIGGVKGSYVAEITDLCVTYPKKRVALLSWADREYPAR